VVRVPADRRVGPQPDGTAVRDLLARRGPRDSGGVLGGIDAQVLDQYFGGAADDATDARL